MSKIELNLIERALAGVSPSWGVRRLQYKGAMALLGSYNGASLSRAGLRGWRPVPTDANDNSSADLPELRGRCRDLVRNTPLAGGAINTMVSNVVGTGLSLQANIDAKLLGMTEEETAAWQDTAQREYKLWSESVFCDATSTQNIYGLQSLAFRSALESGDLFAITPEIRRPPNLSPYKLALQLIEADRVCNPALKPDTETMISGIELDGNGAPVAANICNRHPRRFGAVSALKWTRVQMVGGRTGRRNVIHLFDRRRPDQVRGVPILAPVIEPLKQLGRYTDAELQAAVISGAFSVFVKMDHEAFSSLFEDTAAQNTYLTSAMGWDGSLSTGSIDGAGKAVNLLPGESIESTNPGRPNSEFDPFMQAITRQIGVALEVPFEVLIKHFTASYSAARAALLDAWRFFRGRRDWLATYFCQPVYELFLEEAISIGRISAPGFFADPAIRKAYCGAIWIGDGPGSIDPLKEVQAAEKRIDLEISTRESESIQYDGISWEAKHRQRAKEEQLRRRDGLAQASTAPAVPPADPQNQDKPDLETA